MTLAWRTEKEADARVATPAGASPHPRRSVGLQVASLLCGVSGLVVLAALDAAVDPADHGLAQLGALVTALGLGALATALGVLRLTRVRSVERGLAVAGFVLGVIVVLVALMHWLYLFARVVGSYGDP